MAFIISLVYNIDAFKNNALKFIISSFSLFSKSMHLGRKCKVGWSYQMADCPRSISIEVSLLSFLVFFIEV